MFILERLPFNFNDRDDLDINCQIEAAKSNIKITIHYKELSRNYNIRDSLYSLISNIFKENDESFINKKTIVRINSIPINNDEGAFTNLWNPLKNKFPDSVQFVINQSWTENLFIPNKIILSKVIEKICLEPISDFSKNFIKKNNSSKINVVTQDKDILLSKSNFFNFIETSKSEQEYIPTNTLALIKRYSQRYKVNFKMGMLINEIISVESSKDIIDINLSNTINHDLLSFLANNTVDNTYYFFGKENLQISIDNKVNNYLHLTNYLFQTIDYIIADSKDYNKKLTIYRNSLLSLKKGETEFTISNDGDVQLFNDAHRETMITFDALENEEIQSFLIYKKEILKEYMQFSNQLIESVKVYRNNLFKNLITIIGLIMSKYLLKFAGNTIDYALLVLGVLLLLFFILTTCCFDMKQYKQFVSKEKVLQDNFKYFPKSTEKIKGNIEDIIKNELELLKNVILVSLILYGAIFLFILFWLT